MDDPYYTQEEVLELEARTHMHRRKGSVPDRKFLMPRMSRATLKPWKCISSLTLLAETKEEPMI
jgi:hypothetical protein